jgi:hypothetical protein
LPSRKQKHFESSKQRRGRLQRKSSDERKLDDGEMKRKRGGDWVRHQHAGLEECLVSVELVVELELEQPFAEAQALATCQMVPQQLAVAHPR